MHVLLALELGPDIEFRKEREAHVDRHHLPQRVEAGAFVVLDQMSAGGAGEVADGIQEAMAAAEGEERLVCQRGKAYRFPAAQPVSAGNAEKWRPRRS